MHDWLHAVNELHFDRSSGVAASLCPFKAPHAKPLNALTQDHAAARDAVLCCPDPFESGDVCLHPTRSRSWRRCRAPPCADNRQGIQGAMTRAALERVSKKRGHTVKEPTPND